MSQIKFKGNFSAKTGQEKKKGWRIRATGNDQENMLACDDEARQPIS